MTIVIDDVLSWYIWTGMTTIRMYSQTCL